jgi:hypothetical protein
VAIFGGPAAWSLRSGVMVAVASCALIRMSGRSTLTLVAPARTFER